VALSILLEMFIGDSSGKVKQNFCCSYNWLAMIQVGVKRTISTVGVRRSFSTVGVKRTISTVGVRQVLSYAATALLHCGTMFLIRSPLDSSPILQSSTIPALPSNHFFITETIS
jgi:hypothetical protein